jgi:hypothetical protein
LVPALNDARFAAPFTARADALVPPAGQLGLVDWKKELVVQAVRPVTHFGDLRLARREERADALELADAGGNLRLLVAADHSVFTPAPGHHARFLGLCHQRE